MFLPEGGGFFQPYFISAHLWYHTMFLLEEGVFIQPCSISYGITLWLKKNEQLFYFILHVIGYFTLFLSLLYWLSLGFSMASSRGSCRESCPSFLNSYKSPAQGLAMLKSRHIPSIWNRAIQSEFLTHRNVASPLRFDGNLPVPGSARKKISSCVSAQK